MADIFQTRASMTLDSVVSLCRRPLTWLIVLFCLWWALLAVFYAFPQIDIWVSEQFFLKGACLSESPLSGICGSFPYAGEELLIHVRRLYFYLPVAAAVLLALAIVRNLQHHGATYNAKATRQYWIALVSGALGPYLLVNLILKTISGRPRPYQTDFFGGAHQFTAAGTLDGSCLNNCSFISGEAAGAGWMACLIVLLPPRLRLFLGPPLIAFCLVSPFLRVGFGGHYLSDAVLGFLSSCVVYAAVTVYYGTQVEKNRWSKAGL
ncbi:phosphatase PAP2 family protein [Rhizobium helianthi]|uniref:Phosphatase PAP2 family protein n=1 Tax=Rhizobium helianthi TaxID=1132695 RepID=A0ABW4M4K7_9HYPH